MGLFLVNPLRGLGDFFIIRGPRVKTRGYLRKPRPSTGGAEKVNADCGNKPGSKLFSEQFIQGGASRVIDENLAEQI